MATQELSDAPSIPPPPWRAQQPEGATIPPPPWKQESSKKPEESPLSKMWGTLMTGPRFVKGAVEGAAGAGVPEGKGSEFEGGQAGFGGRMIGAGARSVIGSLWSDLVKAPGEQLAGEKTRGEGERSAQGLALAMAGRGFRPSMTPGAAPASAARSEAAAGRLADFEGQSVTPSVPAIGQGRNTALAAQVGRLAPFSPVERGITQNLNEAAGAAERGAAQFGQAGAGGDAAAAAQAGGSVAQNAMKRFAADKSEAATNYGKFWQIMHGAPPAPVTRSLGLLRDAMGKFPSAPELEGLFTSPKLARLREGLEPKTITTPAKTSAMLDQFGRPMVTTPASTVTRGGTLSVPELKELQSHVGKMLENPTIGPDSIPRGEVKRLYAALTGDLLESARQRGPAAVQALSRATSAYNQRMKVIDRLDTLTNSNSSEGVFRAINSAASQGGADAGLLTVAKKTMSPDEWKDVGSAIVRRLGSPPPGAPRPSGGPQNFSVNSFATNWRRLSDQAKDSFFGPESPGSPRAGLEQLYRVTNSLSNVSRLANTSHSGEIMMIGHGLSAALGAIADGSLGAAAAVGGTAGGAWAMSRALMSPAFTRWIYSLPQTVAGAGSPSAARALATDSLKAVFSGGSVAAGADVARERASRKPDAKRPIRPSVGAE